MHSTPLAITAALMLAGCAGETTPPNEAPTPAATTPAPVAAAPALVAQAHPHAEDFKKLKAAGMKLGKTLKGKLQSEIKAGGASSALDVCNTDAKQIEDGVLSESGVKVGRSSLRLRNPEHNAAPDWVATWLKEQGERKRAGVEPAKEVVETPDGKVARLIVPLEVEAACLACHGPTEQLAEGVAPKLAELYPDDQAVGYALGDLRGALWAEAPVAGAE